MDRTNLLITGGIICVIAVLLGIGMFLYPNSTNADNSTVISNSSNEIDGNLYFDNSTSEATAISIARLNERDMGFSSDIIANASLNADGKYWIVKMHNVYDADDNWVVTIDAKTLMSKKDGGLYTPLNTWMPLDELKAKYIAEIQLGVDECLGKPYKITLEGKAIWKVPTYISLANGKNPSGYVYVDVQTGKSKTIWFDVETGKRHTGEWRTLKEVDDSITHMYDTPLDPPYRNVLRNLYPE